jgi:hypothetical protein
MHRAVLETENNCCVPHQPWLQLVVKERENETEREREREREREVGVM